MWRRIVCRLLHRSHHKSAGVAGWPIKLIGNFQFYRRRHRCDKCGHEWQVNDRDTLRMKLRRAACKWIHKKDHFCWDDMCRVVLPGNRCWFCNRCSRVWHEPNPRQFATDYGELFVTTEYSSGIVSIKKEKLDA